MMNRLSLALAALLLVAAGPPGVVPPSISPSTLGQPNGPVQLDNYGRLSTVPSATAPGVVDQGVVPYTSVLLPRVALSSTVGEFPLSVQMSIPAFTGGTSSYEKAGIYVRINQADPSDNANGYLKDGVGIESQAQCVSGNMVCRVWAFDSITTVNTGTDGYASGMELTLTNNGSDQPSIGTSTSKNGIHIVSNVGATNRGTSAVQIDGKWHHGISCPSGSVDLDCFFVTNGTNTLAQVTGTGAASFATLSVSNGTNTVGPSTPTFVNLCNSTSGVGYYASCLFGNSNTISAQYAAVGGFAAYDNAEFGSQHFSSANFSHGAGDGQLGVRVLYGSIPAGGGTVRLTSQNGAASSVNTIPFGANHAMELSCKLIAHLFNGQDSANWSLDDALLDQGATKATTRLLGGAWTSKNASSGASGILTPTIAADTTYGSVNISVAATSGGPWDIVARCFSSEAR